MADNYSQSVVRLVVAQICRSVGWDSINSSALEVLVDLAERHISQIGKKSRRYSEQFGRVDPSVDDLEMVFRDVGINVREVMDYVKNVEPISLGQPVSEFPVESQAQVDLFVPELDDDGKISVPKVTFSNDIADACTNDVQDSPGANSRHHNGSPLRTANSKTTKNGDGRRHTRFKMRTLLMMEDGEISSLFAQGKPPAAGRPPKPLHEANIPKLRVEPISKPRIKTGILKPKPKPKSPPPVEVEKVEVEIPTVVAVSSPAPEPIIEPVKLKPSKKAEKRKKKIPKSAVQPEGFTDIFGTTLEKPQAKSKSKSKVERRLSVALENITVERPVSSASAVSVYMDDMSDSELRSLSPDYTTPLVENKPGMKARLKRYGVSIDAIVVINKSEMFKYEAAEKAFSFDDRPATPVVAAKTSLKSPSKKSKSPAHPKSSPSSKPLKSSGTAVEMAPPAETLNSKDAEVSPKTGKKKHKNKKKSRRHMLLERFAAAPMETLVSDEPPPIQREPTPPVYSPPPMMSPQTEPVIINESVKDVEEEDDEEIEVNVDEDSDVDILEGSTTILHPPNPYSAYTEPAPGTPPFPQPPTDYSEPMEYDQPRSSLSHPSNIEWEGYAPAIPPSLQYNSQMIDFGAPEPAIDTTRKEKHKKEKKEKKEKKKKKHKEKDRERRHEEGHKHKHQEEATPYVEEESSQDAVPRLTLKIGGQALHDVYDHHSPELDTSYSEHPPHTADTVPKLLIKPMEATASYSSYPETASFAPEIASQPFPATTDYTTNYSKEALAMPDADGKIWICPACGKPDDGSPMIGCDGCDEWYHWPCVGILEQPPDDVEWFCAACAKKDKKKKKKRKKEKH